MDPGKYLTEHWGMAAWGLLFAGALYFLVRKHLESYLAEKGKNYASKEDFAEALQRIERTTLITEDIKASIAGAAWQRQQIWNSREKYYTEILTYLAQLEHGFQRIFGLCHTLGEYQNHEEATQELRADFQNVMEKLSASLEQLTLRYAAAKIFFSHEAVSAVDDLIATNITFNGELALMQRDAGRLREISKVAIARVQSSAQQDLGKNSQDSPA